MKPPVQELYSEEQHSDISQVVTTSFPAATVATMGGILPGATPAKRKFDWRFIKDSAIVGLGSTIARVLGLVFQILLARFLTQDDFGFVRYSITLAGVLTIVSAASPASIARFLAVNHDQPEARERYFSNGVVWVATLLGLTLVVSVPLLVLLNSWDFGTLVIIVGLTGFFAYFALVRGLSNAWKMGLSYILTNVGLIVMMFVVLGWLHIHTATAALAIYGLGNLLPLIILEIVSPTKIKFRRKLISRPVLWELARFSWPLIVANGAYTLWFGIDVLLIQNFMPQATGAYAAAKTLSLAFIFVPTAITLVLMPKVAAMSRRQSVRYGLAAVLVAVGLSLIGVAIVGLAGNWIIGLTFGTKYNNAFLPLVILSIGMTFYSIYVVMEGFMVGLGRPGLHAQAMVVAMLSATALGFWLTPWLGATGASLSFTIGAAIGLTILLFNTWKFLSSDNLKDAK